MTLLRGFHLRASRYGGRVAASAGQALRVLVVAFLMVIGGASSAFACPVCFGAEESHLIDGTKLGILVLLGITLAVQGAFVAFFVYLRNRARRVADIELDDEWSELQRTS